MLLRALVESRIPSRSRFVGLPRARSPDRAGVRVDTGARVHGVVPGLLVSRDGPLGGVVVLRDAGVPGDPARRPRRVDPPGPGARPGARRLGRTGRPRLGAPRAQSASDRARRRHAALSGVRVHGRKGTAAPARRSSRRARDGVLLLRARPRRWLHARTGRTCALRDARVAPARPERAALRRARLPQGGARGLLGERLLRARERLHPRRGGRARVVAAGSGDGDAAGVPRAVAIGTLDLDLAPRGILPCFRGPGGAVEPVHRGPRALPTRSGP